MLKHSFLNLIFLLIPLLLSAQNPENTRDQWLEYMDEVARPVMSNLADDQLKENMPVELSIRSDYPEMRERVAYLEAFARTLSGIAPWLDSEGGSPYEVELRNEYRGWALQGIGNATDPEKNDYFVWEGHQPLVDASFFALGMVRSPWLWENLDEQTQKNVITALESTRSTIPIYSNWLLFTGMIEAFFAKYDLPYDAVRIDYGIREFANHWYAGDGMFTDGEGFAMDYYNSYVIQPYLTNILDALEGKDNRFDWFRSELEEITETYADIQERSIHSDGSFPVQGRSIVYRGGAFHHLADMALRQKLPDSMKPAQVRGALTAVIQKTLDPPGTFKNGWLTIGLSGHQPELADVYNNTGSLYICSTIFLPLGLPADDPFWTDPDAPWTSVRIWEGED
ncbi:MAG: DUF2264 domain-containing protein [Balneolaceae bacterium]